MCTLKILLCREVGEADFQKLHLAEDGRPFGLEELALKAGENLAAGIGGDEIADSPLVVDDAVVGELFVAAHHRVGVHPYFGPIFPDGGNPVFAIQLPGEDFLADGVCNLEIYRFVRVEFHIHGDLVFYGSHAKVCPHSESERYEDAGAVAYPFHGAEDAFR